MSDESTTSLLQARDLSVRYGGVVANDNITLSVEPGETAHAVTGVPTRSAASPRTIPTTACLAMQ